MVIFAFTNVSIYSDTKLESNYPIQNDPNLYMDWYMYEDFCTLWF